MMLAGTFILASSPAHAMNKAELIESMSSGAGLSKADSKRALDAFINNTSGALKKGDKVIFGKYSGTEVKVDGDELLVMREEDIMAVIEG